MMTGFQAAYHVVEFKLQTPKSESNLFRLGKGHLQLALLPQDILLSIEGI